MKINRLVVPLTAFAAAAALTACGGSGEEASAKPVTVWMYPVIADEKAATAYWTQVEKDFEAANTDVDLRIEQQPWANRDQKLATAFSGGKGPDVLPAVLARLMQDIGIPNGLAEVGYGEADVDDLVDGALKQQRLLATAPKDVTADDLATIIRASLSHW